MKNIFYTKRSGASLIVAVGMAALLIIVTLGVSSYIQGSVRSAQRVEASAASYFAAEGELEKALYNVGNLEYGYEEDTAYTDEYVNAIGKYSVHSVAKKSGSIYAMPTAGYGTYGGEACDGGYYAESNPDCQWNIVSMASPADVYLFNEYAGGTSYDGSALSFTIKTPDEKNLQTLGADEKSPADNPMAVKWVLTTASGYSETIQADSCTLSDACEREVLSSCTEAERMSSRYYTTHDQITLSKLDPEYVWNLDITGMGGNNEGKCEGNYTAQTFLAGASGPYLTLDVVKEDLTNISGDTENYLIYQMTSDEPVLEANVMVRATGVSGDYPLQHSTELYFTLPQGMRSTVYSTGFLEQ